MADFVLVHGAWHGAWCWQRIVPSLWAAGHRVFAVTLTGVGERAHLLSKSITLDTHIADVVAVIETEELLDPILVGHSYGGVVITGVAARLTARLRHLVYVDAIVLRPGESWSSTHAPETQAARRQSIAESGALPAPDPALFGLSGADRAWVARRQTPHPGGVYDAALAFDPEPLKALPRTFVDCTSPALPTIATSRQRVRSEPGWNVIEIATGHDPMISAPRALLDVLTGLT
ncbi:MAG: alpha/beta hydrolase family protein [Burkholderiaceae bacterium]